MSASLVGSEMCIRDRTETKSGSQGPSPEPELSGALPGPLELSGALRGSPELSGALWSSPELSGDLPSSPELSRALGSARELSGALRRAPRPPPIPFHWHVVSAGPERSEVGSG
eukprot:2532527-Alexandrium_andersonii.AAC.1